MFGFFLSDLFDALASFFAHPRIPQLTYHYTVNEKELVRMALDGSLSKFSWTDLAAVRIVTTDQGPFMEDVFFVLETKQGQCIVIDHSASLASGLTDQLAKLPCYNFQAVIEAMGSTDNASFLVWQAV